MCFHTGKSSKGLHSLPLNSTGEPPLNTCIWLYLVTNRGENVGKNYMRSDRVTAPWNADSSVISPPLFHYKNKEINSVSSIGIANTRILKEIVTSPSHAAGQLSLAQMNRHSYIVLHCVKWLFDLFCVALTLIILYFLRWDQQTNFVSFKASK